MARDVFPSDGLAAIIISSPFLKPAVQSSILRNPVASPVMASGFLDRSSICSNTLLTSSLTSLNELSCLRSDTLKSISSALSSIWFVDMDSLYAASTIAADMSIMSLIMALSLTISA